MAGLNNLSLILYQKGDLRLERTLMPEELGPNECLLQTHSCGISSIDVQLYNQGLASNYSVNEPFVIGHEISATVVETGENVTKIRAGDRVAVEPLIACLQCDICRSGKYNLCERNKFIGLPHVNGGQSTYFKHISDLCHKLPSNVSYEEGALIEPLAVAVHAMKRVDLAVGDNVLICGAGAVGLLCMLCAKAFGANKVFITDLIANRLELAKKLGADSTYLINPNLFNDHELADQIKRDMKTEPNISLECSGSELSNCLLMCATKAGGKIGIVGIGHMRMTVPLVFAALREVEIIGCFAYRDNFPLAVKLVSSGKVNVNPLITNRFNVNRYMEAFNLLNSFDSNQIKILIQH